MPKSKEDQIVALLQKGWTYRLIAKQLGCGQSTISKYAKKHNLTAEDKEDEGIEETVNEVVEEILKDIPKMSIDKLKTYAVDLLDPLTKQLNSKAENVMRIDQLIDLLPVLAEISEEPTKFNYEVTIPDGSIVAFIADAHLGSNGSEYERFGEYIQMVNDHRNCYMISMGDLIDNFNVRVSGLNVQSLISLDNQKRVAHRYLTRYLDEPQSKILGMIQGNHEERSKVTDDYDFTEWLARTLGVNYFGLRACVKINTIDEKGRLVKSYNSLLAHKHSGHSQWNKAHSALKAEFGLKPETRVDLVAVAHWHEFAMLHQDDCVYVVCKTLQKTSRYGQNQGYPENTERQRGAVAVYLDEGELVPYQNFEKAIKYHGIEK